MKNLEKIAVNCIISYRIEKIFIVLLGISQNFASKTKNKMKIVVKITFT